MKAFWVIGDLGVITSNQQIKRDGIQEENFFNKQHNLPTKSQWTDTFNFHANFVFVYSIISDYEQNISRNRMFELFVQYIQKYELLFDVMLVTIMP